MSSPLIPAGGVIGVSRATFDPARLAEVERMLRDTAAYLSLAIKRLKGLLGHYAGASPEGSVVAADGLAAGCDRCADRVAGSDQPTTGAQHPVGGLSQLTRRAVTGLRVRDGRAVVAGPACELALCQASFEPPRGQLTAQAAPGVFDRSLARSPQAAC